MTGRWWRLSVLILARLRVSYAFICYRIPIRRLPLVKSLSSDAKGVQQCRRQLAAASTVDLDVPSTQSTQIAVDDRPHEQRAARPRTARRLNHSFRYLYRHDDDQHNHASIAHLSALEFLIQFGGYTTQQVLDMNATFPPLLDLNVRRHLWPKLRFLQESIGVSMADDDGLVGVVPPQYFGARLERTIAPRHAFLMHHGLPHGRQLLQKHSDSRQGNMLQNFLVSCRRTKQFSALCNTWRNATTTPRITAKQIEAFDVLFQRGLMAAARNELVQHNNSWPLAHVNITSGQVIALLLHHGANPMELDARGVSLLHWAAGCGNLEAVNVLLPYFKDGVFTEAQRDGATPFHWAAAGANAREFGNGGHVDVCRFFLEQLDRQDTKRLINKVTKDGNSVVMWAAWSGTLEVVKLLVRNRADALLANRNGCTVAHWAASGGNLSVCRYLAETVGVDFTVPNYGENTPLTHAVAFGRTDVVEWLRNDVCGDEDDILAADLAAKFVGWTDGDRNRKDVLNLFNDWFGETGVIDSDDGNDGTDEDEEFGSC